MGIYGLLNRDNKHKLLSALKNLNNNKKITRDPYRMPNIPNDHFAL